MLETTIILVLIFFNAFFVASEFATVATPRTAMEAMAQGGSRFANLARYVVSILNSPMNQDRYIATSQVGITFASIGLGMYGEHVIADWIIHQLESANFMDLAVAHTLASITSVVILTYLHIVFGEMIPKSLALQRPKTLMLAFVVPMLFFMKLFHPIVYVLNGANFLLLKKLFKIDRSKATFPAFSVEELQLIVKESEDVGVISDEIGEVVDQMFTFSQLTAEEIMVPRVQMVALPIRPDVDQLIEIMNKYPHSRYPVYSGDKDNIVGFVHIKDLAVLNEGSGNVPLPMRPVPFVPSTASVEAVLEAMQNLRTHMVVVLDEFGGTDGIVTMQDVFEEIVGEIDEHTSQLTSISKLEDGSIQVRGTVRLNEIEELLELSLEETEIHSISGLVLDQLGRPPEVGDKFNYGPISVEVVKLRGRAARLCIVRKLND